MIPETPTTIAVRLVCPECSQALQVDMEVTSQLTVTVDIDGIGEKVLKPKVKAQTIAHRCGQTTLDDVMDRALDESVQLVNTGALGPNVTATRVPR